MAGSSLAPLAVTRTSVTGMDTPLPLRVFRVWDASADGGVMSLGRMSRCAPVVVAITPPVFANTTLVHGASV
jgi:hypothetical protein